MTTFLTARKLIQENHSYIHIWFRVIHSYTESNIC